MKITTCIHLFLALCATTLFLQCTENKAAGVPPSINNEAAIIKKGAYLVGILGCQDCHSPKRMGPNGPEVIPELHLSGYPADRPVGKIVPEALQNGWMLFGADGTSSAGPWGVSFAANLTSDESGIGSWSFEQFKKASHKASTKDLTGGGCCCRPCRGPTMWP